MGTGISFHRQSVEILTAVEATDRYGNVAHYWDDPAVIVVEGCRVVPAVGDETLDRQTRRWVLFAPPDTQICSANRVRWADTVYDVRDVQLWSSPSGALAHVEADLERVEG